MLDYQAIRRPLDRSRVNVGDTADVAYWAKKWGVSAGELKAAVAKVGVCPVTVQQHLTR